METVRDQTIEEERQRRAAARPHHDVSAPSEEMNGHVFERYEEQPEARQFYVTMEALEAYARLALGPNSPDLATLSLPINRKNPTIEEPADLEEGASE